MIYCFVKTSSNTFLFVLCTFKTTILTASYRVVIGRFDWVDFRVLSRNLSLCSGCGLVFLPHVPRISFSPHSIGHISQRATSDSEENSSPTSGSEGQNRMQRTGNKEAGFESRPVAWQAVLTRYRLSEGKVPEGLPHRGAECSTVPSDGYELKRATDNRKKMTKIHYVLTRNCQSMQNRNIWRRPKPIDAMYN